MLEKPQISDCSILLCLAEEYGLHPAGLTFLPLGADVSTAVYRLSERDGRVYFVKLHRGFFDETSVRLLHYFHCQHIHSIINPLETIDGRFFVKLEQYRVIVYPFIEGQNGYEVDPSEQQWWEFGATLQQIHQTVLPLKLAKSINREDFSPAGRDWVQNFQKQAAGDRFGEPVAARLAAFMRDHQDQITNLVKRAGQCAGALQNQPSNFVLCHGDLHAGNLLLGADDDRGNSFYIIDWDNPRFAPKELDLALVGGCSTWNDPHNVSMFYQGYGTQEIDRMALAYYRYERIVQDIAEFCKQLFLSDTGGEDREQSYQYFTGQFLPGYEVEIAFQTD